MFTAVYPIAELVIFGTILYLKRAKDQGTLFIDRLPTNTSLTTISQYYNLYAGPEFLIHYRYSSINKIILISFMYGAGEPVLFLISWVALSV